MRGLTRLLSTGLLILVVGCVAPQPVEDIQRTPLQLQAYQTNEFEGTKRLAFTAVMSVLQDLGYIISSADLDTGFITASSPIRVDNSPNAQTYRFMYGVHSELSTAVTASVEEIKTGVSRIRLNFVDKSRAVTQAGANFAVDVPVHDQQIYSNAFERIGEAIFIRASNK